MITDKSIVDKFKAELKQAKAQQKSDDIIQFIVDNCTMFGTSKADVKKVCDELSQYNDLSVTALAEALYIPDYIVFMKAKVVDTAKLVLKFTTSSIYKSFVAELDKRRDMGMSKYLCLVLVAGRHSMVITNMNVCDYGGLVKLCLMSDLGRDEINVFMFKDAAKRMPHVFGPRSR